MKTSKKVLLTAAILSSGMASSKQFYIGVGSNAILGDLILIDSEDCAMTTVGPVGHSLTGLATDREGNLYGSESTAFNSPDGTGELLRINQSTGAGFSMGLMLEADNSTHPSVPDITFVGPTLYGWTESGDDLMTINPSTAAVESVIASAQNSFGTGLAADLDGTLYLAPDGDEFFTLNPVDGVVTPAFTAVDLQNNVGLANGLTFDNDGILWGNVKDQGDFPGNLVMFDKDTGAYTVVCTGLPNSSDSIAYYGASDLIYKDGFGLLPFIAR